MLEVELVPEVWSFQGNQIVCWIPLIMFAANLILLTILKNWSIVSN